MACFEKNDFWRRAWRDGERSDHMYVVSRCCMQGGDHRRIRCVLFFPRARLGDELAVAFRRGFSVLLAVKVVQRAGFSDSWNLGKCTTSPLSLMLRQLFRSKKEVKHVSILVRCFRSGFCLCVMWVLCLSV